MSARAAFDEHLAAFNAHDSARLLALFDHDAVWVTGRDTVRGAAALAELFDAGLWLLDPHLEVRSVALDGEVVAAELTETILVDGTRRTFPIAVFLHVSQDLIRRATVYREGSADV